MAGPLRLDWSAATVPHYGYLGGKQRAHRPATIVAYEPGRVGELRLRLRDDVVAAVADAERAVRDVQAHGVGVGVATMASQLLIRRGLASDVIPPVSLVLARGKDAYVDALTAWRYDADAGAEQWIMLLAQAVESAALASLALADRVAELVDRWMQQAGRPRAGSSAQKLIRALPGAPIVGSAQAQQVTGANESATLRALNPLDDCGVLQQVTVGKRNRQWGCVGLFALIDDMEHQLSGGQRGTASTA